MLGDLIKQVIYLDTSNKPKSNPTTKEDKALEETMRTKQELLYVIYLFSGFYLIWWHLLTSSSVAAAPAASAGVLLHPHLHPYLQELGVLEERGLPHP